uniref:Uncharacterized protein n=1 Tax=Strigamia maritima TaxID=126957 RepID=T1J9A1_STRMM
MTVSDVRRCSGAKRIVVRQSTHVSFSLNRLIVSAGISTPRLVCLDQYAWLAGFDSAGRYARVSTPEVGTPGLKRRVETTGLVRRVETTGLVRWGLSCEGVSFMPVSVCQFQVSMSVSLCQFGYVSFESGYSNLKFIYEPLSQLFETLEKWIDDKIGIKSSKIKVETAQPSAKKNQSKEVIHDQPKTKPKSQPTLNVLSKDETARRLIKLQDIMNAKINFQLDKLKDEITTEQQETVQRLTKLQEIINDNANQQLNKLKEFQQAINVDKQTNVEKLKKLQGLIKQESGQQLDLYKQFEREKLVKLQEATSIKLSKLRHQIHKQNNQHSSTMRAINDHKTGYVKTLHVLNENVTEADNELNKLGEIAKKVPATGKEWRHKLKEKRGCGEVAEKTKMKSTRTVILDFVA